MLCKFLEPTPLSIQARKDFLVAMTEHLNKSFPVPFALDPFGSSSFSLSSHSGDLDISICDMSRPAGCKEPNDTDFENLPACYNMNWLAKKISMLQGRWRLPTRECFPVKSSNTPIVKFVAEPRGNRRAYWPTIKGIIPI
jgi:DNA polymerase sigma